MPISPPEQKTLLERTVGTLGNWSAEDHRSLLMVDYHGFRKARLPQSSFEEILPPDSETLDIQIEIVNVESDLRHEVHLHQNAHAVIFCLGPKEGFPTPQHAQVFLRDHWAPIQAGDTIEIPANTPHGFTIEPGGTLYFLSIQSPSIVREDGYDDYVRL